MTESEIIKNFWDLLDIKKIDDDINEGIVTIQKNDIIETNKYIKKIQKDYQTYINLYNSVQQLKRISIGINPNQEPPVNDGINHYIDFLQKLKTAKSLKKGYDEIFN